MNANNLLLSKEGIFPVTKDAEGNLLSNNPATGLAFSGTIQGEGKLAGMPSLFIRLASCNLRCIWQLPNGESSCCDTSYATFDNIDSKRISVNDAVKTIKNNLGAIRHVVITGGEPLLQKEPLARLVSALKLETGVHLTLETNGTIFDSDVAQHIDLFSISPKLENSVPTLEKMKDMQIPFSAAFEMHAKKRINADALQSFLDIAKRLNKEIQLKFVIGKFGEEEEIRQLLAHLSGWNVSDIMVMPLGATDDDMYITSQIAFEMAIRNGWRFSPRLHVNLFGNKAGV